MKKLILVALLLTVACSRAPKPALTADEAALSRISKANEVVNVVGAIQSAAIAFNKQQVCSPEGICSPMLSEANTRTVVRICQAAVKSIRVAPDGWLSVGLEAMNQLDQGLGAIGQTRLSPYMSAARVVLIGIGVR